MSNYRIKMQELNDLLSLKYVSFFQIYKEEFNKLNEDKMEYINERMTEYLALSKKIEEEDNKEKKQEYIKLQEEIIQNLDKFRESCKIPSFSKELILSNLRLTEQEIETVLEEVIDEEK